MDPSVENEICDIPLVIVLLNVIIKPNPQPTWLGRTDAQLLRFRDGSEVARPEAEQVGRFGDTSVVCLIFETQIEYRSVSSELQKLKLEQTIFIWNKMFSCSTENVIFAAKQPTITFLKRR